MAKAVLDKNPIDVTEMSLLHLLVRLVAHGEPEMIEVVRGDLKSPQAKTVAALLLGEKKTADKSLQRLVQDLRKSMEAPTASPPE